MTSINAHDYSVGEILTAATMDGVTEDLNTLLAQGIGEETVYIPAGAMLAEDGAAPGAMEVLDNGTICHYGIPFDADTDEYVNFNLVMPKRYDGGSVYLMAIWTSKAASSGSVVWQAEANKLDDGDAMHSDPGSGGGTVTDAMSANYDFLHSAWFEVTPAGTITDDNPMIEFRFGRDADNGSDDLDGDAYLLGVLVRWTSDVETDD